MIHALQNFHFEKGTSNMNDIPSDLIYNPLELDRWLDETSVPLSDDDMKAMSAYFQSEIASVYE